MADSNKTINIDIIVDDKGNVSIDKLTSSVKALGKENKATKDSQASLVRQIQKLQSASKRTADVIKREIALTTKLNNSTKTTNKAYLEGVIGIQKLERELNDLTKTQSRVILSGKTTAKNLGNIKSATGSASGAVVELGRTISDSNYGFPAMANNVQQLATQFTFVVAEQGGVLKGFKALGKAMRGAGGILLLFTVAVTLLEKFALNSRKSTKETNSLAESIGKEVGQLNALISVAKNENLQKKDREDAIKEINQEYPEYLGNLNLEKIRTDDVTKAIGKQIKLEVARTKVKQLSANISKAQEDLAKAELKTAEDTANVTDKISAAGKIIGEKIPAGIKAAFDVATFGIFSLTPKIIDKTKELGETVVDFSEELAEKSGFNDLVLQKGVKRRNEAIKTANSELKKSMSQLDKFMKESGFSFEELFGEDDSVAQKRDKLLDLLKSYQDKVLELGAENEQQLLNIRRNAALKEAEELGAEKEDLYIIEKYYDDLSYDLFLKNIEKRKKDREKDREKEIQDARDLAKELTTIMSERFKKINQIINSVSSAFDSISKISQSYHEGEIQRLQRERDFVQNNTSLSESEKLKSLERINKEEEKAQIRKIKAEQTFLMIQQGILLAETIINAKKMIMEQNILALKLATMSVEAGAEINIAAATNIAKGKMSIGTFFSQLGVFGGIAFAAAIGGIIATIISAKKQAKNQIANLTGKSVPSSDGGGSVSQPDFNIVGASQESQLAQTIAEAEEQPTRAYVVAEDVTTAQQLDRKIIEGASLG